MPCARYDGIYKLPKESHYFSYLPVECADWIAHEGATAEKRFMYMSFWKGCRLRWRLHWWFTPSFLPTLRPLFLMRSGGKWFRHLYIRSICLELSQMRLKTCNSKMVSLYVYRYLFTKVLWDDLLKLSHVVTVLSESVVIYNNIIIFLFRFL